MLAEAAASEKKEVKEKFINSKPIETYKFIKYTAKRRNIKIIITPIKISAG